MLKMYSGSDRTLPLPSVTQHPCVGCQRRLAPHKNDHGPRPRCHEDREGVGHEVADPEEVRWSVEVMMLDALVDILCFSGEAAKNSEPLDGRPEIHGKIEGHGEISISFPSFLPEVVAKGFSTMVISAMVDSNPVFCIHRGGGGVPCILYFPIMSCIMHV